MYGLYIIGDFQARAEVNVQNSDGDTPLHFACQRRDATFAELLLNQGADPWAEASWLGWWCFRSGEWREQRTSIIPNQIRCVFSVQPTVWKSSMPAMDCFRFHIGIWLSMFLIKWGAKKLLQSFQPPDTFISYGPMGNPPFDGESIGILFEVALSSLLKQFQGMIWERGRTFISRVSWIFLGDLMCYAVCILLCFLKILFHCGCVRDRIFENCRSGIRRVIGGQIYDDVSCCCSFFEPQMEYINRRPVNIDSNCYGFMSPPFFGSVLFCILIMSCKHAVTNNAMCTSCGPSFHLNQNQTWLMGVLKSLNCAHLYVWWTVAGCELFTLHYVALLKPPMIIYGFV